jgi:hypothetical protein
VDIKARKQSCPTPPIGEWEWGVLSNVNMIKEFIQINPGYI